MTIPELKRPQETPYDRLKALGIILPAAPPPIANFVTHVQEGKLLFLSGQGPSEPGGNQHTGKVGAGAGDDEKKPATVRRPVDLFDAPADVRACDRQAAGPQFNPIDTGFLRRTGHGQFASIGRKPDLPRLTVVEQDRQPLPARLAIEAAGLPGPEVVAETLPDEIDVVG